MRRSSLMVCCDVGYVLLQQLGKPNGHRCVICDVWANLELQNHQMWKRPGKAQNGRNPPSFQNRQIGELCYFAYFRTQQIKGCFATRGVLPPTPQIGEVCHVGSSQAFANLGLSCHPSDQTSDIKKSSNDKQNS